MSIDNGKSNLGKSSVQWRQSSDMTVAVDWDVKHEFNSNKQYDFVVSSVTALELKH